MRRGLKILCPDEPATSTVAAAKALCSAAALSIVAVWIAQGSLVRPAEAQGRPALPTPHADLPDDFRQVIPRGRIASVDDPDFVTAGEAEIPDDAWIFGVEVNGEARAYSLNLLNQHEIVNDEAGGEKFAAVW